MTNNQLIILNNSYCRVNQKDCYVCFPCIVRVIILISTFIAAVASVLSVSLTVVPEATFPIDCRQTTELLVVQEENLTSCLEAAFPLGTPEVPQDVRGASPIINMLERAHSVIAQTHIGLPQWAKRSPQIPILNLKIPESTPEDLLS